MGKYQDLKIELQRLWNTSVEIIPIVVGALGAISSNLQKYLQKLNINDIRTSQIQNSAIENSKYLKETSWSVSDCVMLLESIT